MNRWIKYNPNPLERRVGDCAIRACCKATNRTWNEVFDGLVDIAMIMTMAILIGVADPQRLEDTSTVRITPACPAMIQTWTSTESGKASIPTAGTRGARQKCLTL